MYHISVDIETYSDTDIKSAGAYKYALDPAFDILLIAYAVDDGPVTVIDLVTGDPDKQQSAIGKFLRWMQAEGTVLHAYNAAFEWWCINQWLRRRYSGAPGIPISKWRCTMAHGMYCGYPAGLAAAGAAVGLPEDKRKLGIGSALIRKFCIPQKPSRANGGRTRVMPEDDPEKWTLFKRYCAQDVETEREIERRLSPWPMPVTEQRLWELDVEMNACGVAVDRELVQGALAIDNAVHQRLIDEASALTGLGNPKSVSQLTKWLTEEIDEELPDLRKDTVAGLLARVDQGNENGC